MNNYTPTSEDIISICNGLITNMYNTILQHMPGSAAGTYIIKCNSQARKIDLQTVLSMLDDIASKKSTIFNLMPIAAKGCYDTLYLVNETMQTFSPGAIN